MKNFDLEKAKAGYPVRTRDGHEATHRRKQKLGEPNRRRFA